jgi:hypothetical protein
MFLKKRCNWKRPSLLKRLSLLNLLHNRSCSRERKMERSLSNSR